MKFQPVVFLSIFLTILVACTHAPTEKTTSKGSSHYIRREPGNRGVIVFVHGVIGNSISTWTNSKTGAYWPELIKSDPTFSGFDIFVLEYPSPLFSKSFNIDEVAENMRLVFDANRITNHTDIVFLVHSMGGLVTRAYIQKYQRKLDDRVKFIFFFSTPTDGAEISRLGEFLSQNPQYGDMAPIKSDSFLANLMRSWQDARFKTKSYCAYETKPMFGLLPIVSMSSASALCTEALDPIDTDHENIVKPRDKESTSYLAFRNAFIEVFPESLTSPKNVLYFTPGPFHIGDQDFRDWAPLSGSCFDIEFNNDKPIKRLTLTLETYGAEANNPIILNQRKIAIIPPQGSQRERPNEWSKIKTIDIPIDQLNGGFNKLSICSSANPRPEFEGDKDDYQIRNIQLSAGN